MRQGFVPALVAAMLVIVLGATAASAARGPKKTPKKDAVAGELIVRFRVGTSEEERGKALAAAEARAERDLAKNKPLKLAKVQPEQLAEALKKLRSDARVVYAEPNYRLHALATPNDPSLGQLWGLVNTGQTVNAIGGTADADIDADQAWNVSTGSDSVVVGVIDTGVDFTHRDLAGVQWTNPGESGSGRETNGADDDGNGYVDDWRGWDFVNNDNNPHDDHGHGTHVSGTIAARGNDGAGIVGVNWQAKVAALKFLDSAGSGSTAGAVEAIEYATAAGIPITNNSWGGGEKSLALRDAIAAADAAGSLFVAAAGNDGNDNDAFPSYPASYDVPNVLVVAASDQRDAKPDWSNYGRTSVDLAAPGANVYSTVPGGGYDWWDGTSMATPHVAGTAALAKAAFPGATALGLKALLLRTVDPVAAFASTTAAGGRLDAGRALACSAAPQLWLDSPGAGFRVSVGEPIAIRLVAGSCGAATASVTVTVTGAPVELAARGDGLYTATYSATAPGAVTVEAAATAGGTTDTRTVAGTVEQNYHYTEAAHEWIDATAGGTKLTGMGDETIAAVALPFAFSYWNEARTSVRVSSNGFLAFGSATFAAWDTISIPDASEPNGLVAPYWDDLWVTSSGSVWYRTVGTAPNRRFVVSWNDVVHYGYSYGAISFQAVLEEGTNAIVFNYRDTTFGDAYWDHGNLATIGVERVDGLVGRQFSHRTPALAGYAGVRSLRWAFGAGDGTPPPPPPADTTPPAAPTALTAVAGDAKVTLDWADNAEGDFAGYAVQRSSGDGTWATVGSGSGSAYVDTTVVNGTTYSYRVTARDAAGNESAPSATVTATPRATQVATYRPGAYNVVQGSLYSGTLASLYTDDADRLTIASARSGGWSWATFAASTTIAAAQRPTLTSLEVEYDGNATTTSAWIDLMVYNYAAGYWEYVDGGYMTTGDRLVTWTTRSPLDYVSSTGLVRVRVAGDAPSSFRTRTDLIRFTVEY